MGEELTLGPVFQIGDKVHVLDPAHEFPAQIFRPATVVNKRLTKTLNVQVDIETPLGLSRKWVDMERVRIVEMPERVEMSDG